MNVHMVNESESDLQLGRHNADNISLTELLCSSLSSSPVVARLSPGCEAYVELVSDWQPFAPVPFCMALLHRYCLHWLVWICSFNSESARVWYQYLNFPDRVCMNIFENKSTLLEHSKEAIWRSLFQFLFSAKFGKSKFCWSKQSATFSWSNYQLRQRWRRLGWKDKLRVRVQIDRSSTFKY